MSTGRHQASRSSTSSEKRSLPPGKPASGPQNVEGSFVGSVISRTPLASTTESSLTPRSCPRSSIVMGATSVYEREPISRDRGLARRVRLILGFVRDPGSKHPLLGHMHALGVDGAEDPGRGVRTQFSEPCLGIEQRRIIPELPGVGLLDSVHRCLVVLQSL